MPRIPRIIYQGCPHHITQRGNNRQKVFLTAEDYIFYINTLKEYARKYDLRILGYCLMPNHVHLIVIPSTKESLIKTIGVTNYRYTMRFNKIHGCGGHLWQNRFYSCPMDEKHLIYAMAYIERNPVRAKLAEKAWFYKWSSAETHIGGADRFDILESDYWKKFSISSDWISFITQSDDEKFIEDIRFHTKRGKLL